VSSLSLYDTDKLNELLENMTYAPASLYNLKRNPLNIRLNLNSTLKEVAEYFNIFTEIEYKINHIKETAPDLKTALELLIEEIEFKSNLEKARAGGPLKMFAYAFWSTTKGNRTILKHYAKDLLFKLVSDGDPYYTLMEGELFHIARGVGYAYELPKLKKTLAEYQSSESVKLIQ
jgi:hypothetical protein